ncbi:unnamed protein product [Fusarium graminearum]|nr:unnamed protein product [Fusarium graminearum]CAF3620259.1 unnamed protein product [Fusarium graminearum]
MPGTTLSWAPPSYPPTTIENDGTFVNRYDARKTLAYVTTDTNNVNNVFMLYWYTTKEGLKYHLTSNAGLRGDKLLGTFISLNDLQDNTSRGASIIHPGFGNPDCLELKSATQNITTPEDGDQWTNTHLELDFVGIKLNGFFFFNLLVATSTMEAAVVSSSSIEDQTLTALLPFRGGLGIGPTPQPVFMDILKLMAGSTRSIPNSHKPCSKDNGATSISEKITLPFGSTWRRGKSSFPGLWNQILTAIQTDCTSLDLLPEELHDRSDYLQFLGIEYETKFSKIFSVADSNMAGKYFQKAVDFTPEGDPKTSERVMCLALLYDAKYQMSGEKADLDEMNRMVEWRKYCHKYWRSRRLVCENCQGIVTSVVGQLTRIQYLIYQLVIFLKPL